MTKPSVDCDIIIMIISTNDWGTRYIYIIIIYIYNNGEVTFNNIHVE